MEDKSPSFCKLCNVALASPSIWRQHAKSDWHVYNLRLRVAEPGTVVTPPSKSPRTEKVESAKSSTQPSSSSSSGHESGDEGDTKASAESKFHPEQCLFCGADCGTFDDNLAHMSKSHSFSIPHQDNLTVDLETLVGYLHLVIHGYGECILCAARRSTVKGIQHHMTAKGHCRFNVASDMAEFYEMPTQGYQAGEESLRLPSGKLVSHRPRAAGPAASKTSRQPAARRSGSTALTVATPAHDSQLAPTQDNDTPEVSSSQLSRLSRADQQSLAHLPDHEIRSVVATGVRHIDQSRRQETQAQLKLEKASNITLTAHFRADTSKRFRGPWG